MSILVCNHLDGEERAGCFTLFAFTVSRDCCAALPHGAMDFSTVCDCWYFLIILIFFIQCIITDKQIELDERPAIGTGSIIHSKPVLVEPGLDQIK